MGALQSGWENIKMTQEEVASHHFMLPPGDRGRQGWEGAREGSSWAVPLEVVAMVSGGQRGHFMEA